MHKTMRMNGMDIQANDTEKLIGRKVRVYWNLHKKLWSIQDFKTRKVIGYSDFLKLSNVELKVYEKGRLKVIKEMRKNVHAFCVGTVEDFKFPKGKDEPIIITYNPFQYKSFVTWYQRPINKASMVWCIEKVVYASNPVLTENGEV